MLGRYLKKNHKNWVHVFKFSKFKMKKKKKPFSSNFLKIEYDEYELGENV
jgi:hypothetical protein